MSNFFRTLIAVLLTFTVMQASAQSCNQIRNGNGQVIAQECFSGGNWTPNGYNIIPGIPALFPRSVPVNIPAGYHREECDANTYTRNMVTNTVRNGAVGAVVGLLAGDSRAAASKGAAVGALTGIAESLQCFVLVKDPGQLVAQQKKPRCAGGGELAKNDQDGTMWCVAWQDRSKGLISSRTEPVYD